MAEQLVIRSLQDVARFINRADRQRRQNTTFVLLLALGGIFTDAYDFASLGIGAVQLRQEFDLSPVALGTLTAIMAAGAMVGGTLGGYYTDRFGRLKMFFVNMLLFVIATLVAALAPNYGVLFVARFFMGVGVGLDFPVALSFITEYFSIQKKGGLLNLWQMVWYIAGSCCYLLALVMIALGSGPDLWRYALGFGALPAFVILVLRFLVLEESPMWEAARGNLAGAARILNSTYHVTVQVDPAATARTRFLTHGETLARYREIFSARYRLRTLQAVLINTTQSMEYYAVGFYLPSIALLLFGSGLTRAIIGTLVFNLFGILGGGLQAQFTTRIGIRNLAIIGFSVVIFALLVLGVFGQHFPPVIGAIFVALFIFGHSFGPGSQGATLSAMSFPTQFRGAGAGFSEGFHRIGSIAGFYFFPLMIAAAGLYDTLVILSVVPFIGLLATITIRWDPTNRDVDIESEYVEDEQKAPLPPSNPAI